MLNRLMCLVKCVMHEGMVTLRATPTGLGGEYVAVSKPFEEFFGYTHLTHPGINLFAPESQDVASAHGEDSLAGPYIAKCIKSDTSEVWMIVQGFSWIYESITWRSVHYQVYEG